MNSANRGKERGLLGGTRISDKLSLGWPWWSHPIVVVSGVGVGSTVLAFVASPDRYESWGTPKYLTSEHLITISIGLVSLLLGLLLGSRGEIPRKTEEIRIFEGSEDHVLRAYRLFFALTIIGYTLWVMSAIRGGAGLSEILSVISRDEGAISGLKKLARPIAGLTTLTQFGQITAAIGVLLWRRGMIRPWFFGIGILAVFRATFYAERLGLLEILVPTVLVLLLTQPWGHRGRLVVNTAPFWGGALFVGIFAASEYFRSWISYSKSSSVDFWQWVISRLGAYYATALNNGALFSLELPHSARMPYFTLEGVWSAPGLGTLVGDPYIAQMPASEWWSRTLEMGNPEFTNKGSFLMVDAEIGMLSAIAVWLLVGLMMGSLFFYAVRGTVVGLIGFSMLFVGLLEVPRIFYFGEGRAIPVYLSMAVLFFYLNRPRERLIKVDPDREMGSAS